MRFLSLLFVTLFATQAFAWSKIPMTQMFTNAIATGASSVLQPLTGRGAFQCQGTVSASTGASVITLEGSNFNSTVTADWIVLVTSTLTLGTTSTSAGGTYTADWKYLRARINSISGTTATVNCYLSNQSF